MYKWVENEQTFDLYRDKTIVGRIITNHGSPEGILIKKGETSYRDFWDKINSVSGLREDIKTEWIKRRRGFSQVKLVDSNYLTYIYDPEYAKATKITEKEAKGIRKDLRQEATVDISEILREIGVTEDGLRQLGELAAKDLGDFVESVSPYYMRARALEKEFGDF